MTPLALDPSDTRPPAPPSRSAAKRPLILLSLGAVVIGGGFALWTTLSDFSHPRRAEIRIGRVEDWPEIKDGVPELKTAGTSTVTTVSAPAAPPASAPFLPSSVSANESAVATLPAAPILSPPPLSQRVMEPAARVPAAEDRTASIAKDQGLRGPALKEPAAAVVPAPVPPRRPAGAQEEPRPKDESRAKKVAAAPRSIAPARPEAAAPAPSPPPVPVKAAEAEPPEADHVKVLGLEIPTFASTGRKIKQTVESVGETVRTLPDRF